MVSIIMMACIIGIVGGISALSNSLGRRKFKKAFIWLILIIACCYTLLQAQTSDLVKNKLEHEEKQQGKEAIKDEDNKLTETKNKRLYKTRKT
jgi:uncharacterized membrane protein YfcA